MSEEEGLQPSTHTSFPLPLNITTPSQKVTFSSNFAFLLVVDGYFLRSNFDLFSIIHPPTRGEK